jgi:hypothetical protein
MSGIAASPPAGFDLLLRKPFGLVELRRCLASLLALAADAPGLPPPAGGA